MRFLRAHFRQSEPNSDGVSTILALACRSGHWVRRNENCVWQFFSGTAVTIAQGAISCRASARARGIAKRKKAGIAPGLQVVRKSLVQGLGAQGGSL
jgi:hypothetical protein